jgi:hypothetical protein
MARDASAGHHPTPPRRPAPAQLIADLDASHDILGALTDSQRRNWARDPGLTINQTAALLQQPKVKLVVNVKLIGFHGEG